MDILFVFLGSLQYDLNHMETTYSFEEGISIKNAIQELSKIPEFKAIKNYFTDSYESTRSIIIFLNEQEISVLKGMDSKLKQGDKLTFIPVIHGG